MKNIHASTYKEIFEHNQYQKFIDVNNGDFVLDLGCSQGPFYFKNYDKDTPSSTCCNEEQFVYTEVRSELRHDRITHPDSKDLAKTRGLL